MKKRIYLHVGLPKTATTWLQKSILPNLDLKLVLWQEEKYQPIIKALQAYYRGASHNPKGIASKLLRLLDENDTFDTVLISNENISVKIVDFWNFEAVTFEDMIFRSSALRDELQQEGVDLSLIFVSRDHAEWMASRYAESAKRHEHFSQEHFESLVVNQKFVECSQKSILSYSSLKELVETQRFGDWFHLLNYESFQNSNSKFLDNFIRILGKSLPQSEKSRLLNNTSKRINNLKLSTNKWSLKDKSGRPSKSELNLNEKTRLAIDSIFMKPSNLTMNKVNKGKKKIAILVLSVGDRPWFNAVRCTWEHYANKCSADLIVEKKLPSQDEFPLGELPDKPGRPNKKAYAAKAFLPWKYLNQGYEQVLMIDDTCCINKNASNIFELASEGVALTPTGVDHALDSFSFINEQVKTGGLPSLKSYNTLEYGNTGVVLYNESMIEAIEPRKIIKAKAMLNNRRPHQTLFYYLMARGKVPITMLSGNFNKVPGTNAGKTLSERKSLDKIGELFDEDVQIYHVTGLSDYRQSLIEDIVIRLGF